MNAIEPGHDGERYRELLKEIETELERIGAAKDVLVSLNAEFEPKAGTLLKVELGLAFWHLRPEEFLEIARDIPDAAGSEAVKESIEKHGVHVWHGPAPKQTRQNSP